MPAYKSKQSFCLPFRKYFSGTKHIETWWDIYLYANSFHFRLYHSCLTSVVLEPLSKSFNCELNCIKSFLVTLNFINKWKFFEAIQSVMKIFLIFECENYIIKLKYKLYVLFQLDFGRRAMLQWGEYVQNSAKGLDLQILSSSKMSFFESLRSLTSSNMGSSAEQVCTFNFLGRPTLCL